MVYSVVKYLDYTYQFFLRRQICMNDLIYMYLASGLYDKQLTYHIPHFQKMCTCFVKM